MEKSRTTYSLMNMGAGIAGYFVNTLVGFVCRIFFVKCLPAEYLGLNGLFSNVLSMLSLAELGIGSAIIYALYKPLAENDKDKIASIMKFYASAYRIIGCVVAAVGLALMPFLKFIIRDVPQIDDNLYVIYLAFLFNTCLTYFFSYRGSLIQAAQRQYVTMILSNIITVAQSVLQIVALLIWREYMLYLAIQTVGVLAYNLIISRKAIHDYPYIKEKNIPSLPDSEKKKLFKNIRALTVNKLSMILVNSSDNIIITFFSGLKIVGYTSNYVLFSGILDSLTKTLFDGLTAGIGNLNATGDHEEKYRFFKTLQFTSYFISGWMSIGIWLVSSDLVALCFGSEFLLSPDIPFILGLNFYILRMNNSANIYRETMGLFKYGQYTLIFTAGINIAVSILFGKIWGVFGILLATSVARLTTNEWYIPYCVFKHGLDRNPVLYFTEYLKYAFFVAVEGGICFAVCHFIRFVPLVNVILKMIVCTAVPFVVTILVFRRTDEYKYLYGKVRDLLQKFVAKIMPRRNKGKNNV